MDSWSLLIGGLAGLGLVAFGVRILVTGRMPGMIRRSFRTERDAALYHLLFGVGLLLLVGGTFLPFPYGGSICTLIAAVIALVAVIKYRPRSQKRKAADQPATDAEERARDAEARARDAEERAKNAEKLLAEKTRRPRTQDRAAELLQAREAARARETGKK